MGHVVIVVEDAEKAHQTDIDRNVEANLAAIGQRRPSPQIAARVRAVIETRIGLPKEAGDLFAVGDTTCPDGLPNCRDCGDPAFEVSCRDAGHCPCCGHQRDVTGLLPPPRDRMGHGVAPQAYIAASGLSLLKIAPRRDGEVWDRQQRKYVPA